MSERGINFADYWLYRLCLRENSNMPDFQNHENANKVTAEQWTGITWPASLTPRAWGGKGWASNHVINSRDSHWGYATEVETAHCILTYEADYYYTGSLIRGIQNLLRQKLVKEQKRIQGKVGQGNYSRGTQEAKMGSVFMVHRLTQGVLRMLTLCLG